MKKFILFSIAFFLINHVFAQTITIAEARALPEGTEVTVTGTTTNGQELGIIRYFQDGTAGIAAYGGVLESVNRHDSITVTGVLKLYNGLLEIEPINDLVNHGPADVQIQPLLTTPSGINEENEGKLLEIEDAVFADGGGTFASGTYSFTASGEDGIIYLRSNHPLIGTLIPVGPVNLTGISSQFSFSGTGGYQLLPRDEDDIFNDAPISIISSITIADLSTDGFGLSWVTDVSSSTGVFYGTDPENLSGNQFEDNNVTEHAITISGLESGQVYFFRVYSVAGTDTAKSSVISAATVSLSSGEMKVYFNKPVDQTVANPADNLAQTTSSIWDTAAAWIDKAMITLDIAMYNFNNIEIANAINAAYNRGVAIRMIVEGGNANIGLEFINDNIPVLERENATGSGMHNKFMIIDAEDTDNAWIMSGSTNFTDFNMSVDFNNMIFIQDQALARAYRVEFEEMWGGSGPEPDPSKAKFGEEKSNNTPHQFIVNGEKVELYFSPSDGTTSQIIKTIMDADASVNFATLVFTRDDIADAVIDRNSDFFVTVSGLIDQINTMGSEYENLLDNFVNVRSFLEVDGQLHHKYVIVDVDSPEDDPVVLTGSHNWSSSAENSNDENTLIIHDALVANQYFQEYTQRFADAVGIEEYAFTDIGIYPNPVSDQLYISAPDLNGKIFIYISDISGKVVYSEAMQTVSGNIFSVDFSEFDKGLYTLTIQDGVQSETLKVIKN